METSIATYKFHCAIDIVKMIFLLNPKKRMQFIFLGFKMSSLVRLHRRQYGRLSVAKR